MTKIPSVEERVAEFQKEYMEVWAKGIEPVLHVSDWLTQALTAEREAGAKEVLQELRDIFKDTHEIGTNHLNSELDRLENK